MSHPWDAEEPRFLTENEERLTDERDEALDRAANREHERDRARSQCEDLLHMFDVALDRIENTIMGKKQA